MVVEKDFYVGYSKIDKDLELKNTSILEFFENIACIHGVAVGDDIKTTDARWFLTGYKVKVHNRPQYATDVRVKTWSRNLRGAFACREFEIVNPDSALAVTGISNWARVNGITGKLERMDASVADAYLSEPDRTNFNISKLEKIKEPEEYTLIKDYYIDRNFIDLNRHMNNICYLELAEMVLPEDVYSGGQSDEFEIMYRNAVKYGETVKCLYCESSDSYTVAVKSEDLSEIKALIKLYKK